jgi:hypothetical protein
MKKYIFTIICSLFVLYSFSSELPDAALLRKPIKISINFLVARPAMNCEEGIGICKLSGGFGRLGGDGRLVSGEASVENAIMTVSILKEYTEHALQDEISAVDYYIIEREVAVPQALLDKMGLKDAYSIAEGKYRIMQYPDRYEINFDLK